jgi:hypothetical protein
MKTSDQEIEIRLTTKKIINLTKGLENKNLAQKYFKALQEGDIEFLAELIFIFGEFEEKSPFNGDRNKVYDFIDKYKKENNKTYLDIYKEIAEAVNEEGFFVKKMTQEELKEAFDTPVMNIDAMMEEATKNVAAQVIAEEFRGHQG